MLMHLSALIYIKNHQLLVWSPIKLKTRATNQGRVLAALLFFVRSAYLVGCCDIVTTELDLVRFLMNCEGRKRQKERQIQRQVDEKCDPAKSLPR